MKVIVNNKEVETQATRLQQLAKELSLPEKGVAVAINNRLVPRTDWTDQPLTEGDSVVIIKAVCGG